MNSTGNRLRGTLDLEYPLILSTPNDSALYNDPLFDIPPGRGLIIRLTRQQIRPDANGTSSVRVMTKYEPDQKISQSYITPENESHNDNVVLSMVTGPLRIVSAYILKQN